jgi:FtsZ-interacting cell division protein YlmF
LKQAKRFIGIFGTEKDETRAYEIYQQLGKKKKEEKNKKSDQEKKEQKNKSSEQEKTSKEVLAINVVAV